MKKLLGTTAIAVGLAFAPTTAFAQDSNTGDWADDGSSNADNGSLAATLTDIGNTDNSLDVDLADSLNDNSDNSDRSDNSLKVDIADSFNDNSDNSTKVDIAHTGNTAQASTTNLFGDGAQVATSTLASYVTGVTVDYRSRNAGTRVENNLTNQGNSFQNFAGMQALNQNTGVGSSQNAAVSVAVSTRDVNF